MWAAVAVSFLGVQVTFVVAERSPKLTFPDQSTQAAQPSPASVGETDGDW